MLSLFVLKVSAQPIFDDSFSFHKSVFVHGFYSPNELYPETAKAQFEQTTPGGLGMSVGTERAFIHASYAPISHLITIDIDPHVVQYNRMNTALLVVSKNPEEFRYLKAYATFEEWQEKAKQLPFNSTARKALEDSYIYKLKTETLEKDDAHWKLVTGQLRPNRPLGPKGDGAFIFDGYTVNYNELSNDYDHLFSKDNYHFDEKLFNKLKSLAEKQKIESHIVELGNKEFFSRKLFGRLLKRNLKLSYLDISNAWIPKYTKLENIKHMVDFFEFFITSQTRYVITRFGEKFGEWNYLFYNQSQMSYFNYTHENGNFVISTGGVRSSLLHSYKSCLEALSLK